MQVECIFQDSRGYIWAGTRGGVSRFNGETFENILLKDGLPSLSVRGIAEDSKGNIWFSTTKGLAKYNGQNLVSFPSDIIQPFEIEIDERDRIWLID